MNETTATIAPEEEVQEEASREVESKEMHVGQVEGRDSTGKS
jgi:hypothetical protein